ncbi:hypothetical protein KFK09_008786 [Dendrobium nobile]|uniref:DUF4283 domain-containing protein n=1 Tax=Dendrobium nobile TaxID=94219 RepID=A0A8T3BL22_DENNO|nr:hypothetical protein KFK09_008786 [Dendrobium nobile]
MAAAVFPPLPSPATSSPTRSAVLPLWKNLLTTTPQISTNFSHSLSFVPTNNFTANFTTDQFVAGAPEWALSLVGYSIGKRPFYEALLGTIKKTWQLKGERSLLTMDDGFFLLKFTALEDYEHAWTGGPWFFFGKPFILQKWSPYFVPKREEFPSIPLWVKILNLPLSLWTPEGISKLASCIGIPIAVDALTAAKTRLTFARVCVQVTSSSPLPEEIFYSVDGKVTPLRVAYDWKPEHCSQCGSIMHPPTLCPKDPILKTTVNTQPRGCSSSRKPRPSPPPRLNIPKPTQPLKLNNSVTTLIPTQILTNNNTVGPILPNLNSPSGEVQENPEPSFKTKDPPPINTANKFQTLIDLDKTDEVQPQSSIQGPILSNMANANTESANLILNHNSPPHTSPRNHQPNIPTTSNDTSSSTSNTPKAQHASNQNQKQTRGKTGKKASTPNNKVQ